MIGAYLPSLGADDAALDAATAFEPNVWVKITADNKARIMLSMLEMGQGVMTAMPMLLAEELDLNWNDVTTEWAPADVAVRQPELRRGADHGRQQQHARHVARPARRGRERARDAHHRCGADVERSREPAHHRQGRGDSPGRAAVA